MVNTLNFGDTPDTSAALAMVPAPDNSTQSIVALLDVDATGLHAFYERETGYKIVSVPYYAVDGGPEDEPLGSALLCAACDSDAEADALWAPGGEMEQHCPGSRYAQRWMQSALRPLWPAPEEPLLPSRGYLRLCAQAHRAAGMFDHFVDSTLLNDSRTILRDHMLADPDSYGDLFATEPTDS